MVERTRVRQPNLKEAALRPKLGEAAPRPIQSSPARNPSRFANRSNREEDEFFTEGIHDDLLAHLANIGSLEVISRTSVMRYKNSEKSIPEIAANHANLSDFSDNRPGGSRMR